MIALTSSELTWVTYFHQYDTLNTSTLNVAAARIYRGLWELGMALILNATPESEVVAHSIATII